MCWLWRICRQFNNNQIKDNNAGPKREVSIEAGPAEGGVPGVHVHPLFLEETPKNLPENLVFKMPFIYCAPPVFSTLRRAWLLVKTILGHKYNSFGLYFKSEYIPFPCTKITGILISFTYEIQFCVWHHHLDELENKS